MRGHVIVATKGRPREVRVLLDLLAAQSAPPASVTVVGADEADVEGLDGRGATILLSGRAGLPLQRNHGLRVVREREAGGDGDWFAAYFDDDFRPDGDWMTETASAFASDPAVVGLTGRLVADGIKGPGLTEEEGRDHLAGRVPPGATWASWPEARDTPSVYGCNMAFRAVVSEACEFDERLPLYAWQEDRDYTGQALAFGRVIYTPGPVGVHLGVKGGRTSGERFGYSQIANPLYLGRKGTMAPRHTSGFVAKALAANAVKSLRPGPLVDYRGRLRGNARAVMDLALGRLKPERVLEL